MSLAEKPTPLMTLVVRWAIVALPLAWGIYQSVVKSLPLFGPRIR